MSKTAIFSLIGTPADLVVTLISPLATAIVLSNHWRQTIWSLMGVIFQFVWIGRVALTGRRGTNVDPIAAGTSVAPTVANATMVLVALLMKKVLGAEVPERMALARETESRERGLPVTLTHLLREVQLLREGVESGRLRRPVRR
jgi:hypothetical protein